MKSAPKYRIYPHDTFDICSDCAGATQIVFGRQKKVFSYTSLLHIKYVLKRAGFLC